jgi:hypothetical protein
MYVASDWFRQHPTGSADSEQKQYMQNTALPLTCVEAQVIDYQQ